MHARVLLNFSTFIWFRIPFLGDGATLGGLGLPTAINGLIKTALHRYAHWPAQCRQPSWRLPSQLVLGCVKLTSKSNDRSTQTPNASRETERERES